LKTSETEFPKRSALERYSEALSLKICGEVRKERKGKERKRKRKREGKGRNEFSVTIGSVTAEIRIEHVSNARLGRYN
jgi:hypothetical protein